jgi:RNA polymerase sigma-70 factor (ECF subfamily)
MPDEPEALGLLALLLHCQARRAARLDDAGRYVPLSEQDTTRWDASMIVEAETALSLAARHRTPGRFQLEAAIQSVHAQRARTGDIHWPAITALYQALLQHTPALGARIGHAIALSKSSNPAAGFEALEALPHENLQQHQPYWAARAHLLAELGNKAEARVAYQRAIGLSQDPAIRTYLQQCMER